MKKSVQHKLETIWYQNQNPSFWLKTLSHLFNQITKIRRFCYRQGLLKQTKLPVPVIIVGNLTVGGTGKSPLVIYLAELLSTEGYTPGIISRGYGGTQSHSAQRVFANSDPKHVGDEAVMIANKTGAPVAVCTLRAKAAELLLSETTCNVIISDDGLQHYGLYRDIEIVVIDGERRFGNGYCLPAGPLRETIDRLQSVDMVVVNGKPITPAEFALSTQAEFAVNAKSGEKRLLQHFSGIMVHAVTGIGNPQRFFNLLSEQNILYTAATFPDHYQYQASDLQFNDDLAILMTEKDAVKCRAFASPQHWYVPIKASLPPAFNQHLLQLLQEKQHGS